MLASPLAGWLAKVSDGWPAACMTACHPMSPSSRRRHACLPPSPSYAAPLGQANYPLARIPICFPHSHQCYKEKAKVSCHYRPTPPPQGKRAMPLLECLYAVCMLGILCGFHIPIDELTGKLRYLAITVLHSVLGQAGYPLAGITKCFSYPHR